MAVVDNLNKKTQHIHMEKQLVPVTAIPCGLVNLGNTCCVNTLLQCILHSTPICTFILKNFEASPELAMGSMPLISYELGTILTQLTQNHETLIPKRFIYILQYLASSSIDIGSQIDIGELWCWIVDKIHRELRVGNGEGHTNEGWSLKAFNILDVSSFNERALRAWSEFHKGDCISWMKCTEGLLVSQIVCSKCKHVYHNHEPHLSIELDLVGGDIASDGIHLSQCFGKYLDTETINGNLKQEWKCDHCKSYAEANKLVRFWKTPKVLTLTLKRFEHSDARSRKNNVKVIIPLDFKLLPGTDLVGDTKSYKLCAVANHYGSLNGGHYNAMCRTNDIWWEIDDAIVRKINVNSSITSSAAYMLFYELSDEGRGVRGGAQA